MTFDVVVVGGGPAGSATAFTAAKAGLRVSKRKTVFLARGDDRVGALTGVLGKLAKAKINLVSLSAVTAGKRRYGMLFWVKKRDVGRASRVLGAR